jgi:hypothetical protein
MFPNPIGSSLVMVGKGWDFRLSRKRIFMIELCIRLEIQLSIHYTPIKKIIFLNTSNVFVFGKFPNKEPFISIYHLL